MTTRTPARERGVVKGRRPPPAFALASLAVTLALPLLLPPRAEAFVRYKTKSGIGFFWPQTCVPVSVYPASMTDVNGNMEMTTEAIVGAATAAAAAWSADANACSFLRVNVTASTDATPKAKLDYNNVLVFRTTSWCAPTDKPGECSYPPEALAITSVFDNKNTGKIIDGDIEVNAKNFVWTDLDLDPMGRGHQDLQNALTHEMGHLIGLDHTCYEPDPKDPTAPAPLDASGRPLPTCSEAPADVQATTMFASAIPGDVAKRTLAPDDIAGVCDIYPIADDPMFCPVKDEPPPESGCDVGAGAPVSGSGVAVVLGGLAALMLAARRRRA